MMATLSMYISSISISLCLSAAGWYYNIQSVPQLRTEHIRLVVRVSDIRRCSVLITGYLKLPYGRMTRFRIVLYVFSLVIFLILGQKTSTDENSCNADDICLTI